MVFKPGSAWWFWFNWPGVEMHIGFQSFPDESVDHENSTESNRRCLPPLSLHWCYSSWITNLLAWSHSFWIELGQRWALYYRISLVSYLGHKNPKYGALHRTPKSHPFLLPRPEISGFLLNPYNPNILHMSPFLQNGSTCLLPKWSSRPYSFP